MDARGACAAPVVVDWAMRYGNPSIAERLTALAARGCERILIVPLYPQYAAATTASVCDAAFAVLKTMRRQPSVRIAPPWYDDPPYIEAVAASVRAELERLSFEPEVVLASFHGMPRACADMGDPYSRHCAETARLLREALGLPSERFMLTFQSRFGPAEWLKPYTIDTVAELARRGIRRLAAVMPGFAADCLETIEEIGIENARAFRESGGTDFVRIPCLNDSDGGIDVLEHVVRRELSGWI
jgi:ferrochelatase